MSTTRFDNPRFTCLIDFPSSLTLLSFARKKRIINRFICATNLIYLPREALSTDTEPDEQEKNIRIEIDMIYVEKVLPHLLILPCEKKHKIDGHLNVRNHFWLSNFCQDRRKLSGFDRLFSQSDFLSRMRNEKWSEQRRQSGEKLSFILLSNERSLLNRGKLISLIALIMFGRNRLRRRFDADYTNDYGNAFPNVESFSPSFNCFFLFQRRQVRRQALTEDFRKKLSCTVKNKS